MNSVEQTYQTALQHHQAGRLPQAEQLYRNILAKQPNHAESLHLLGVIAAQQGRNDIAADLMRRAISIRPNWAQALGNLANALKDQGQFDEAIDLYRQAIALNYNQPDAHYNLGNALREKGRLDQAVASFRQAIAQRPKWPQAWSNLGEALRILAQVDEAIAACRSATALNPNHPQAHYNLGVALKDKGEIDGAVAAYRQAIALKPDFAEAHCNLGNALKTVGQVREAIAEYRRVIALKPDFPEAHSNLVLAMHYDPGYDAAAIAAEHRSWNRRHADPLKRFSELHANDRNPDRRLRIGYVSPDFREHVVARNILPLFNNHDRQQFEITCYAHVPKPDAITGRFQQKSDHWRNIENLSDEQVAGQIRGDRIDILVDLALHTGSGRLLVFARKPAPVQATFAGYPGSTGLTAIDYRLSDPYIDPPGMDESIYSERTIRLADSFWCYDPTVEGREILVNSLPAGDAGVITFGCLNNFCKINEVILELWAKVMSRVQGSRLLLLAGKGSHRQRTLEFLSRHGVVPSRVEFVDSQPRRQYLETYRRIDVGLDSFPYNGHTTSLDSFWMGVPVVTLMGDTAVSRAGWCQLSNLSLTELAARAPEQFVRIAGDLANDLPRLENLRSTLRTRMEQSPLMDAPRFARNIEAAYRRMWQTWCEQADK